MSLVRAPKDNAAKEQGDSYGQRLWEIWPVGGAVGGAVGGWRRKTSHQTQGILTVVMRVGHRLSESLGRKDMGIDHLHQRNWIDQRG